ncbi:MAG: GAF domain-containing protein [Acidobacteria bacterium]|nr:GAF domain-containing protein [Acidobacteriota bacterium]
MPQTDLADLNAALKSFSRQSGLLMRASGIAVALFHKGSMICRASMGNLAPPLGCRLDVTSGLSGECIRTGKALRCDDSERDARVDVTSCRRLGVRSVLAAPVLSQGHVVGLVEVFSGQPTAFDDGDLALLARFGHMLLRSPSRFINVPLPSLLIEREPVHRIFLHNLLDTVLSYRTVPSVTSPPARFWDDVFIPSKLPWKCFAQSLLLHIIMAFLAAALLKVFVSRPHMLYPKVDQATVYYLPFEDRSHRESRALPWPKHRKQVTRLTVQEPLVAVRRERFRRTPAGIPSPVWKMKADMRQLQLPAWNSALPAMPMVASARTHPISYPAVAIISPPPDTSNLSRSRVSVSPQLAVIEPAPLIPESTLRNGPMNNDVLAVVPPPPAIDIKGRQSISGVVEATLRTVLGWVVPPPPSLHGVPPAAGAVVGSFADTHIVPPPPTIQGAENSTWASREHIAAAVVPPPPSAGGFLNARHLQSLAAAPLNVRPPHGETRAASVRGGGSIEPKPRTAEREAAGQTVDGGNESPRGSKELSVHFVGPVLPLPRSSYFSSSEVFIAEERLSRTQMRLIKLIYEYLPYQKPLSDYGPNYPALEKLRVTRDPNCDEALIDVIASAHTAGMPSQRLQREPNSLGQGQSTLACFRTTADDYRKAAARQHQ